MKNGSGDFFAWLRGHFRVRQSFLEHNKVDFALPGTKFRLEGSVSPQTTLHRRLSETRGLEVSWALATLVSNTCLPVVWRGRAQLFQVL